jgi:hypothetical protein
MMIVRKLLDYVFNISEISALDDLLPGQKMMKTDEDKMEEFIRIQKKLSVPTVQISVIPN